MLQGSEQKPAPAVAVWVKIVRQGALRWAHERERRDPVGEEAPGVGHRRARNCDWLNGPGGDGAHGLIDDLQKGGRRPVPTKLKALVADVADRLEPREEAGEEAASWMA